MSVTTLEQKLRKHENLVGTKIRLQDGAEWTFPACPLEGAASDVLTALIVEFSALGDAPEPAEGDTEAAIKMQKNQNRIVLDLSLEALQINYPEVTRPHLVERVTKAHVLPIMRAVNGLADITEFMSSMGGDDDPVRAGN